MPKKIISDPKYLSEIKRLQLRQQAPPLALLALSFLTSFAIPLFWFHYPSLILALIAIAWYLYVGFCFRFKERISIPDGDVLLSPITGKVGYRKTSSDICLIKIRKTQIDRVDIRCPYTGCTWEEDTLRVCYQEQNLVFRFEGAKLHKFNAADMVAGNMIGYIYGSATVSLSIPLPLQTSLQQNELCDAGLSVILES